MKNADFDNKAFVEEEHEQDPDEDIDNESLDEDEFIDGLKKKQDEVNFDKLTKRQKMYHMAKIGKRGQFNDAAQDDYEDFSVGLPLERVKRVPKNHISQAQADEIKRKELEKILEEQHKKMQDRQDRIKGAANDAASMPGGVLGRYVTHNSKQVLQKPGMEQFAISIKLKGFKKESKDDSWIGGPCPGGEFSGFSLCFPKGVELPECLK